MIGIDPPFSRQPFSGASKVHQSPKCYHWIQGSFRLSQRSISVNKMENLVIHPDTCSRLIVSWTNLVLNSVLLILLIIFQYAQCARIIKSQTTNGISPYHFFLDAFYQTLFMSSVLYISSFPEGPIECCRPHDLHGPDRNGDNDWHLKGIQAYGVLLGALQVSVIFLGALVRLVLFCLYTTLFPPLTGNSSVRVMTVYARITTGILSAVPIFIFADALATTLTRSDTGGFLSNSGEHMLMMSAFIFLFYFFFGWLQHLPQILMLWKNTEAGELSFGAGSLMQWFPMILLGVSLGLRGLQWAQSHLDELHEGKSWFKFLYFMVGACEAWIIGAGQVVMVAIMWRSRRRSIADSEDGDGTEGEPDELTGLLTPTSSIGIL